VHGHHAHDQHLLASAAPKTTSVSPVIRLRNLLEASRALTSELSLDALLERIVEAAAEPTGSRYAALGVIDRSGGQLERFVTTASTPRPTPPSASSPAGGASWAC
jgi:hypothetical protein